MRFGKWSEAAFFAALNVIRDPAPDDADPDLREMLVIAFVSVLCGATGFVDIAEFGREQLRFFNRHLKLKLGVSSRDTFSTTFRMLDPNGSTQLFGQISARIAEALGDTGVIAIDGKALNGAHAKGRTSEYERIVSSWPRASG